MEEDIFVRRLRELALRASHRGEPTYTHFLDLAQAQTARVVARETGVSIALNGGYPDAERCVAAFYMGEAPETSEWPICPLRVEWNEKFSNPGHRDLLGAVMHLGIERETTGDIVMGEYRGAACAYLFALDEIADYVVASLERAGHAALKVTIAGEAPVLTPPRGDALRLTVQQERLDAVLQAANKNTVQGLEDAAVGFEKADDEHIDLSFVIEDTGIGMKEEDMDRLFSPFSRIEESRNRSPSWSAISTV